VFIYILLNDFSYEEKQIFEPRKGKNEKKRETEVPFYLTIRLTCRGVKKLSNFCNYSYCKIGTRVIEVKTFGLQCTELREHQSFIEERER